MMSELIYVWDAVSRNKSEGISLKHHHNAYELLLVLEGQIMMNIEGKKYHLSTGQMAIISRLETHDLIPAKLPYRRIGISIGMELPALLGISDTLASILFRRGESFNHVIDINNYPEIIALMRKINDEFNTRQSFSNELLGGMIYELLIYLYRRCPDYFYKISCQTDHVITQARHYIDNRYSENLRVRDIARHHHFSVSYFISAFKRMTGYTPKKYIILCRLTQVRCLLANTDYSINEIAEKTGFEDANSLIRCFRQVTGITPRQFKRLFG